jgi:hypothetical protein
MKRVFASVLLIAVLILCLSVPTGAESVDGKGLKSVLLWSADENWRNAGEYEVDTENQIEGEGCVSLNLKGWSGVMRATTTFDSVDATGMLALEFDMYISDLALLDHWLPVQYGYLEIGSGHILMPRIKKYEFEKIIIQTQNTCPYKSGWNHVIIPLEDMTEKDEANAFDISNISVLSIYWTQNECEQDWVLKFDNFVLTDRQDASTPHTPGQWHYDEEKHWTYCEVCDKKIEEAGHSPYASSGGNLCEEEFTCYDCGQVCGPFAHEFTVKRAEEAALAAPPACTRGALYYYRCARCGENGEETFEVGGPRGHKSSEGYLPCGAEGHAIQCENCGENLNDILPHNLSEWAIQKEPTETEEGVQKRTCKWCSYSETEVIPKTDLPMPDKSGCSAVIGGVPILAVIALAAQVIRKKK